MRFDGIQYVKWSFRYDNNEFCYFRSQWMVFFFVKWIIFYFDNYNQHAVWVCNEIYYFNCCCSSSFAQLSLNPHISTAQSSVFFFFFFDEETFFFFNRNNSHIVIHCNKYDFNGWWKKYFKKIHKINVHKLFTHKLKSICKTYQNHIYEYREYIFFRKFVNQTETTQ